MPALTRPRRAKIDAADAVEAFGALAQPTRLAAFRRLIAAAPEGIAAGALADELGTPHNTLSAHLAILAQAGLVTSRREGRSIRYSADLVGTRAVLHFLVADCCKGRPELCSPIADALNRSACC